MKNRGEGGLLWLTRHVRKQHVYPERPAEVNDTSPPGRLESSVDLRGENDIPELGGGGKKLDRHERTFLIHLRRTDHVHLDFLLGLWILDNELGALRKALGKNNHRPCGAHRMCKSLDWLGLLVNMDERRHPQENTLGATAFFGGRLPRQCGTHPSHRTGFRIRRRFHRSITQNSISGATSSMPYSQPSGRWLPFHTTIAALLVSEILLVRASRCSRSSDCARTTMHP